MPPVRLVEFTILCQDSPLRSDERATSSPPTTCTILTRYGRGVDNPHRESGTRFGLRQTLERQAHQRGRLTFGSKDDSGTVLATPLGYKSFFSL
jgi:hypothetical protein